MILLRSLGFALAFYMWSAALSIAMTPLLFGPWQWVAAGMRFWARGVVWLLSTLCAIRVEFRGLEHLPIGPGLIAAKHQCMFDTMGPLLVVDGACYVMKRELTQIPLYGWLSRKTRMIVVDREGYASALRKLLSDSKARVKEGRRVIIFPEGSRTSPGERRPYQPGVAGIYRSLGVACTPMATNSGVHWPAHGFRRTPGTIVFQFLPPIRPGLSRQAFMSELEDCVEQSSALLLNK